MGLAEVFAEERSFAVQHVFMPAAIYYYVQDIYKFFTVIFLFESFEYLIGQLDHNWGEEPGDSLVGDILMAVLGMLAVRQFQYRSSTWWQVLAHVLVLVGASVLTVQVLWDEIIWAYVFYGLIATIIGVLISIEWAAFTFLNVVVIACVATLGFTQPFSHVPLAALITLPCTTLVLYLTRTRHTREIIHSETREVRIQSLHGAL